jgi:hypothetical protein
MYAPSRRGELAVFGLLGGQCCGSADRELIKFLRGGAVVQAAYGLQCHAQRIDTVQAFGAAGHRAHDLVDVDDLLPAVALGHAHLCGVVRRRQRKGLACAGGRDGIRRRRRAGRLGHAWLDGR